MRAPADKDSFILRQALRGLVSLDAIPFGLRAIIQKAQRQRAHQGNREVRQLIRSNQHRAAALAGGGAREVAQRARQIVRIAAK